jgi:hypothetical protein
MIWGLRKNGRVLLTIVTGPELFVMTFFNDEWSFHLLNEYDYCMEIVKLFRKKANHTVSG